MAERQIVAGSAGFQDTGSNPYQWRLGPVVHYQSLVAAGTLGEGYATDDGVAIHYRERELHRVIADTADRFAYRVLRSASGGVVEERLQPQLLA
ncbi:MAG: hypothetical protein ABSD82_06930 [Solirubrobacteraceae bacterium]|jgi:hypothetical protein